MIFSLQSLLFLKVNFVLQQKRKYLSNHANHFVDQKRITVFFQEKHAFYAKTLFPFRIPFSVKCLTAKELTLKLSTL